MRQISLNLVLVDAKFIDFFKFFFIKRVCSHGESFKNYVRKISGEFIEGQFGDVKFDKIKMAMY